MSTKPSWPATLCEWLGCAGIGLVPGLMSFLTAIFAPERTRQVLLSEFVIVVEVLLWCTVTMVATIVIFISKHNVISELSQKTGVPRLPTSMMLLGNLILLPLVIGQTVFRLGLLDPPLVLPFTFGSVLGTLIASLAFERALARAAHAAAQWRK